MFQSLLGFLMRCDLGLAEIGEGGKKFQSLLGFLMRCDSVSLSSLLLCISVSIPVGFSDALRLIGSASAADVTNMFQSLLGFLMRCDVSPFLTSIPIIMFQSLLGFLMRCDLQCRTGMKSFGTVSIPVGFSDALRRFFGCM